MDNSALLLSQYAIAELSLRYTREPTNSMDNVLDIQKGFNFRGVRWKLIHLTDNCSATTRLKRHHQTWKTTIQNHWDVISYEPQASKVLCCMAVGMASHSAVNGEGAPTIRWKELGMLEKISNEVVGQCGGAAPTIHWKELGMLVKISKEVVGQCEELSVDGAVSVRGVELGEDWKIWWDKKWGVVGCGGSREVGMPIQINS